MYSLNRASYFVEDQRMEFVSPKEYRNFVYANLCSFCLWDMPGVNVGRFKFQWFRVWYSTNKKAVLSLRRHKDGYFVVHCHRIHPEDHYLQTIRYCRNDIATWSFAIYFKWVLVYHCAPQSAIICLRDVAKSCVAHWETTNSSACFAKSLPHVLDPRFIPEIHASFFGIFLGVFVVPILIFENFFVLGDMVVVATFEISVVGSPRLLGVYVSMIAMLVLVVLNIGERHCMSWRCKFQPTRDVNGIHRIF